MARPKAKFKVRTISRLRGLKGWNLDLKKSIKKKAWLYKDEK